jgi:hypothetical protein
MKLQLSISLIGCTLLTLLTPTSLLARIGDDLTDAQYLQAYGTTRRSQTCPSTVEPTTGRISVAQAIKYSRCWLEYSTISVHYADISNFKLSLPRKVTEQDSLRQWTINYIDKNQPIYDIKARAVVYYCTQISGYGPYGLPGKNCRIEGSDVGGLINSVGICFKTLTERWDCRLTVTVSGERIYGPPPAK